MPKGVYERTPEMNAARKGIPKPPRTPEHCMAMSASKKGVPQTSEHSYAITKGLQESDAVKSHGERMHGIPRTPEERLAISKGLEESGANDAMRGGDDICNHHYIYDHSDLSKYTMKMTRSAHTKLHWLMRKANIIVPHINIKEQ